MTVRWEATSRMFLSTLLERAFRNKASSVRAPADRLSRAIRTNYDRSAKQYAVHMFDALQHKPLDRELLTRFADQIALSKRRPLFGPSERCSLRCSQRGAVAD